jgi:tRNA-dihydrouridine synthase B
MITVHARTRQQFYKGMARWNLVREVAEAVDVPVVVNGDIASLHAAREALAKSGARAVMVGRGAQGQPWLVGQIGAALAAEAAPQTPQGDALADLIAGHYEAMLSLYGRELGVRCARKHLGWYLNTVGDDIDGTARKALLTEQNPGRVLTEIGRLFGESQRMAA